MAHADPYADYPAQQSSAPVPKSEPDAARGRSRSRSPVRNGGSYRSPGNASPGYRRRSPPPRKPHHAPVVGSSEQSSNSNVTKKGPIRPQNPPQSNVLGVFGLSIRTQERDLEEEFSRFGRVEKVTIVYDQRTDRSRGFGFITMATPEDATRCIQELNGVDLNGRRIRVDYSVTDRPHAPTPGEYMGLRRSSYREQPRDYRRDDYRREDRDRYDRDRHSSRYDYDRYDRERRDDRDRDRERDRDYYRDSRDYRRSPAPRSSRYSPRRRSYSRSPARAASPRERFDGPAPATVPDITPRW